MDKDSKFTRDDEGYIAVRVVNGTESLPAIDKDYLFARDENGNIAMRVVGAGGGGGGDQHNLGYYATPTALREAHPTAEAGDWAIVGSTDTVWIWDDDNSVWVDSDQKGQVTSVNGQTGDVVLDLLPDQTGNAGKFLTTNGTDASWGTTIQDRLNITLNSANAEFMRIANQGQVVMQLQQFSTGSVPQFIFYWRSSSSQQRAIAFQGTSVWPNQNDETLGKDTNKWDNVYTTKINNGSDITVPNTTGTMVVADYTGATAGQALKLDSNGNAVWENITITPATAPTLVAANWSSNTQTITVQGVTANNTVIVGPIPTDAQDYADAGILCTGQALNSLTFTCVNVPATDLQVNIVIM